LSGRDESGRIDREALFPRLHTRWLARSYHWLEETDSTNRVALELGRGGAPHGTAVVAEAQHAGRGRLGRSFYSPPHRNLYTSLVLRRPSEAIHSATIVFAAAIAVADAVAETVGQSSAVEIKWPNDVLLGGLKTSGILMEATGSGPERFLVLGIGVNLNADPAEFPEEFRSRATSLAAFCGFPIDRPGFAALLYGKLEDQLERHERGGFAALRPAFEARFRMPGQRVCVTGAQTVQGVVIGVDAQGALCIRCADGHEERVLAGDVTIAKGASR